MTKVRLSQIKKVKRQKKVGFYFRIEPELLKAFVSFCDKEIKLDSSKVLRAMIEDVLKQARKKA